MRWRLEGYADALATAGLSPESPDVHILEGENNLEGGAEAFRRLWEITPRPTAVLAMSDIMAMGVLKTAQDAGVEVPRQLSIAGYDDVPEARFSTPPLTTVHQPSVKKGEQAVGLLVRLLAGVAVNEHITLPTRLVVRASVVVPPS